MPLVRKCVSVLCGLGIICIISRVSFNYGYRREYNRQMVLQSPYELGLLIDMRIQRNRIMERMNRDGSAVGDILLRSIVNRVDSNYGFWQEALDLLPNDSARRCARQNLAIARHYTTLSSDYSLADLLDLIDGNVNSTTNLVELE